MGNFPAVDNKKGAAGIQRFLPPFPSVHLQSSKRSEAGFVMIKNRGK
jgi:hypothetical protein